MKQQLIILFIFCLPSAFLRVLLRWFGHDIGKRVKIGFSIVKSQKIVLEDDAKIGHFNLIIIDSIILKKKTSIKHFNIFKGPFSLFMDEKSRIISQNYLTRAKKGITYGDAVFSIGYNSNITSNHFIDLTRTVSLGSNTVLGGRDSQIWTHGYVHDGKGNERFRVDGEVIIKNNVYLGSGCFINPGITIEDSISIGGKTSIAKNLTKKGMYVGQGLRFIEQDFETTKEGLKKVNIKGLCEEVYCKN